MRALPEEFQSSPVPKDRCNLFPRCDAAHSRRFQSSPVPKDRCNRLSRGCTRPRPGFNPHRSRRTGATSAEGAGRRERAAHRIGGFNPHRSRRTGATPAPLPRGRRPCDPFQSSPVPKDRCNPMRRQRRRLPAAFQSSPVPKDRCNSVRGPSRLDPPRFNPHRSRRTGATCRPRMYSPAA